MSVFGKIVELANTSMMFKRPLHPYTKSLIAAVPVAEVLAEGARHAQHLRGEVPSIADPPGGCWFSARCPIAKPICAADELGHIDGKPEGQLRC